MIQVIERFHKILRSFTEHPERPRSLGELAELAEISTPACANIVRTMTELGYLRSLGKRRGYLPGPTAYFLFAANPYHHLMDAARPEMEKLTQQNANFVILVCEDGGYRRELFCISDTTIIQIRDRNPNSLVLNLFRCSTGIILLSRMEESRIQQLWELRGGSNNFLSEPDFHQFLRKLRRFREQGWGEFPDPHHPRVTCAAPIFQNGHVIAALGTISDLTHLSDPGEPIRNCRATAEQISCLISRNRD